MRTQPVPWLVICSIRPLRTASSCVTAPRYSSGQSIVIRSTGFGPQGTVATLEQMLTPIKMPALLVDGNLLMSGNAQVIGTQGSVHANGNLQIDGNAVTITQDATATGTLTAGSGWDPGGLESGGMPRIPVPDIHAIDYYNEADFVLRGPGAPCAVNAACITNRPTATTPLTVSSSTP